MAFQPVILEVISHPAVVRPGDVFTVTLRVKNAGSSPAPFPCEALVRLESEDAAKSFSARFTPSHPADAWPAGAVLDEGPLPFLVPPDAPGGIYRVSIAYYEPYTLNAKPPEWQAAPVAAVTVDPGAPPARHWSGPHDEPLPESSEQRPAKRLSAPVTLRTHATAFELDLESGSFRLHDHKTGRTWESNPFSAGFATCYLRGHGPDGRVRAAHVAVNRLELVEQRDDAVVVRASPKIEGRDAGVAVDFEIRVESPESLRFSYTACSSGGWSVIGVRLLDRAFWTTGSAGGTAVVPHRLGLLIEAGSGAPEVRQFCHYTVHKEGYSMAFCGMTQGASALLVTWDDLHARLEIAHLPAAHRSAERHAAGEPHIPAGALIAPSLVFRGERGSFSVHVLGQGDYVAIAKAYREIAKARGLVVPWSEKRKRSPGVEVLKGAADFKPFVLRRTLPGAYRNPTDREIVDVAYTAEEAAALAEHWHRDLGIDRALVVLAGWIRRGYDNQHPDILPAAPEIGGDEGVARAAERIKACGYLFGLHDNYQDMYRDAPSWDENCLIHLRDGAPMKGGVWLGGQAYHMTGQAGLELARRPQNLPEVKRRFSPTAYFIDTTLASPLFESWAPTPQTKDEDLATRRALLDFARELFGVVGSEEGVEWGVPYADYFEGIMSHKFKSPVDAPVVPLFPIVFGDCVQLLPHQADVLRPHHAKWVLDSILYAALPLYHFGRHLYHLEEAPAETPGPESAFARADGGWAEGLHPTDRFIKNTYEVLSHLNRAVSDSPMTDHKRLAPDGSLQMSRFGDFRVIVNYGPEAREVEGALLPAYGFLVDGPTFVAFHALRRAGVDYPGGALFTVRSLDGAPIERSRRVRIYHGFGPTCINVAGRVLDVARETVVSIA